LVFIYPRWSIDGGNVWHYLPSLSLLFVAGGLVWKLPKTRTVLVVLLIFIGTLTPALGFINVYPFRFSFVADHFQYHASLSIIAGLAAALTILGDRLPRPAALAVAIGVVGCLIMLTTAQSKYYRSDITLFEHTLKNNPTCWLACSNLGVALNNLGEHERSLPILQRGYELNPDAEAANNLGNTLAVLGRPAEALPFLNRAIEFRPTFAAAYTNRGIVLSMLKREAEALAAFRESVRLMPENSEAQYNLGLALARTREVEAALLHFEKAVRLNPNYAEAELDWGIGLMLTNRFSEAMTHFEKAIQLRPDSIQNHLTYGRALAKNSRWEKAVDQYQAALELDPDCMEAHKGIAGAFKQIGRLSDAQYHLGEVQRLQQARPRD
jgi:tetratricopeptide (TPR) repeat protein